MLPTSSYKRVLAGGAFALVLAVLPARNAFAGELIYTFTGIGTGTIASGQTNESFTSAGFTLTYEEQASAVTSPDTGYYELAPINGTFTEGSYTTTFSDNVLIVNGNTSAGGGSNYETVYLFASQSNPETSIGMYESGALANYQLSTPVDTGAVTTTIGASDSGGPFTTTSGTVDISSISSLEFSVVSASAVPEPATLGLLALGVLGIGLARRRLN